MVPTLPAAAVRLQRGFSLVELAAALAILSVAVVGLMALMPSGMSQARTAMDVTITAQIAQRLLSDAEQAEFDTLIDRENLPPDPAGKSYCPKAFSFRAPSVKAPQLRYFDDQGKEIVPKLADSLDEKEKLAIVYYSSMRIRPRAELPTPSETSGHVAQVTLQVVRNPNHNTLDFESDAESPSWNLMKSKNARMFATLVGRKEGR